MRLSRPCRMSPLSQAAKCLKNNAGSTVARHVSAQPISDSSGIRIYSNAFGLRNNVRLFNLVIRLRAVPTIDILS